MNISLLNRDSIRTIVWVTSALITITSASAELDCSKLKPTMIQEGEWSSPSNTLRSERFDIFWGDKRSSEPWKDVPTDSPSYFDPREIQPPFSPIRSGPKAASKPSRQKKFPSSQNKVQPQMGRRH